MLTLDRFARQNALQEQESKRVNVGFSPASIDPLARGGASDIAGGILPCGISVAHL